MNGTYEVPTKSEKIEYSHCIPWADSSMGNPDSEQEINKNKHIFNVYHQKSAIFHNYKVY